MKPEGTGLVRSNMASRYVVAAVESMIDGTVSVLLVGDGDEVLTIDPTLPHSHL